MYVGFGTDPKISTSIYTILYFVPQMVPFKTCKPTIKHSYFYEKHFDKPGVFLGFLTNSICMMKCRHIQHAHGPSLTPSVAIFESVFGLPSSVWEAVPEQWLASLLFQGFKARIWVKGGGGPCSHWHWWQQQMPIQTVTVDLSHCFFLCLHY